MSSELPVEGEIVPDEEGVSYLVMKRLPVMGRDFALVAPLGEACWVEVKGEGFHPVSEADMSVLRAVAGADQA